MTLRPKIFPFPNPLVDWCVIITESFTGSIIFVAIKRIKIILQLNFKALDLWMAGCMLFVFAAFVEFVVVKVLDVQYQYQINRVPKVPMVS